MPKIRSGAKTASGSLAAKAENSAPFLALTAANPGAWGNHLTAALTPFMKSRTVITAAETKEESAALTLQNASGFMEGDLVCIQYAQKDKTAAYNRIAEIQGNKIVLEWTAESGENATAAFLYLVEWNLAVQDETAAEQYEGVSFHATAIILLSTQ